MHPVGLQSAWNSASGESPMETLLTQLIVAGFHSSC